jgi:BlaI family penicillinase repressor
MNLSEKIADAELEIMKILWREDRPVTFRDLRDELSVTKKWEKSTVNTLVHRLAEKGVISTEPRRGAPYSPNVTELDYKQAQEQEMLDKLYDGSVKNFVAALCKGGRLSATDIDELREYFAMGDVDDGKLD